MATLFFFMSKLFFFALFAGGVSVSTLVSAVESNRTFKATTGSNFHDGDFGVFGVVDKGICLFYAQVVDETTQVDF